MHENTITAPTATLLGLVVHASERVFENILRFPRSSRRTTISPLFEEVEFKFQNLYLRGRAHPLGILHPLARAST